MGEQMEKRFTWVLKKFSSLQDERFYSRPFVVAGVIWRLLACRKGDKNDGHLSLYLEFADPSSLPPGWTRDVKFSLTLVTKGFGKSNLVLGGQHCFDAEKKGWGYTEFVSLAKLHAKGEGFLVNNRIVILAELHVLPPVVVPEENVKITGNKDGNQAHDDDDASEEGSDDNDGPFDEGTGDGGSPKVDVDSDDASSPLSDDGCEDIRRLDHGVKSNSVTAETEVLNDDAPKEDVGDETSSLASNGSGRNGTSLDQVKSLEDASQSVVNGGKVFNSVASAKETVNVNGFDVFSSQVESVSHIFRRHPDIALAFRPKNQEIRKAYMNELLSLIETLCQPPEKLSEDDLSNADDTLADLIDVGFKLDWLKTKLNEVTEKKKKEKGSEARLLTMEEQLQKLKLMFLELETQLLKEKMEALAAKAPLSFNDVV